MNAARDLAWVRSGKRREVRGGLLGLRGVGGAALEVNTLRGPLKGRRQSLEVGAQL